MIGPLIENERILRYRHALNRFMSVFVSGVKCFLSVVVVGVFVAHTYIMYTIPIYLKANKF